MPAACPFSAKRSAKRYRIGGTLLDAQAACGAGACINDGSTVAQRDGLSGTYVDTGPASGTPLHVHFRSDRPYFLLFQLLYACVYLLHLLSMASSSCVVGP